MLSLSPDTNAVCRLLPGRVPYERLFDYFFSCFADPDHRAEVRPEPVERLTISRRPSSTAAAQPREGGRVEHYRQ